jgi:hypothetical protein
MVPGLAELQFRPDSKESSSRDLPELLKIDARPYPKVAQFFKELP